MKVGNHMVDYINAQQKICSAEGTIDRKAPTQKVVVLEIFV